MYQKHETGKIGENLAVEYLKLNGYKIIERNFLCNVGEIDIIAKDKDELVFIEVKTRTNLNFGKPKEAVNENKKKHIYRSAEVYIYFNHLENMPVRIDVIEVFKREEKYIINHIKNAITEKPY